MDIGKSLIVCCFQVVEVGRQRGPCNKADDESCASDDSDEKADGARSAIKSRVLIPRIDAIGEVPFDAVVNPEQAESALGHAQATEFDDELLDVVDLDLRAEEEALLPRQQHPQGIDYSCLCWNPTADEDLTPATLGWHLPSPLRAFRREDFPCDSQRIKTLLQASVYNLYADFEQAVATPEFAEHLERQAATLDPTQHHAYSFVTQWAQSRKRWGQSLTASPSPRLRLLLLGTAGTGKTHTAKTFIGKARQTLGSFGAVLTLAFSGVAAANLGDGASTIDSIFYTNSAAVSADLRGDSLERLVTRLRGDEMAFDGVHKPSLIVSGLKNRFLLIVSLRGKSYSFRHVLFLCMCVELSVWPFVCFVCFSLGQLVCLFVCLLVLYICICVLCTSHFSMKSVQKVESD